MSPIQFPADRPSAQFSGRVGPAFSAESQPKNLTFQFLEHSDPDRSTIVRRKAREWVNKSKEDAEKSKAISKKRTRTQNPEHVQRRRPVVGRDSGSAPVTIMELRSLNAFGTMPAIQKDCNHIIIFTDSIVI